MENKQKRVLMLGGSLAQVPCITKAKEMGIYTIICDYLPDNPGQEYADEYYNISTTDKEKVLGLAKTLDLDGIVCYASDPAAPTAAYVAEALGLPTSPYQSVEILSNKDLFRDFLRENGFNCPKSYNCSSEEEIINAVQHMTFPLLIKPVDSSGSKGVSLVENMEELQLAIPDAFHFSRRKIVILEEFVESVGPPIGGDGFSVDGKFVFWAFADIFFDDKSKNPMAPVAETYPCSITKNVQHKIVNDIQRLLTLLDMKTCAYNIEVRIDSKDNVYLMEIGPRSGGNAIPEITRMATGVDMIEYTIKAALGEDCSTIPFHEIEGFWSTTHIHSNQEGELVSIEIDDDFRKNNFISFRTEYKKGIFVPAFKGSNGSMGSMISKFSSLEEMMEKTKNFDHYVRVIVKPID